MPLTVQGEGYRDFSEPRFFECLTTTDVQQIRNPVHKAHALVAAADGSVDLALWKFDATSQAAASATVLVPANPAYAVTGRWISIPFSGGGGGGTLTTLFGAGSPEGVTVGSPGWTYYDTTNNIFYAKKTGVATNTGWQNLVGV